LIRWVEFSQQTTGQAQNLLHMFNCRHMVVVESSREQCIEAVLPTPSRSCWRGFGMPRRNDIAGIFGWKTLHVDASAGTSSVVTSVATPFSESITRWSNRV
jgi:hypothetical protein